MRGPGVELSDETFKRWMIGNLEHAAQHFGLWVNGEALFGWALRSVGARAWTPARKARWLRVVSERTPWVREMPDFWTGNTDANVITEVAKPRVLDTLEWEAPEEERSVRAEVMTYLPGIPCSSTDVLRVPIELPDSWWEDLTLALARLRTVDTSRFSSSATRRGGRVREVFGDAVADELAPQRWETVHGDLHWSNVYGPDFAAIDWEFWGLGPAGTDAATLYLFASPVPDVAHRVHEVFRDVLDSRDGQIAQVHVAARILHRANRGEFADVAEPVKRIANEIILNRARG